jgi:hypothetical protein
MIAGTLLKVVIGLPLIFLAPQLGPPPPPAAQEAAICLAPDDTSLRFLGYSRHVASIPYRYAETGVPESSMKGEPYVSVLFLSHSRRRALLLFGFKLPDGRLEAMYDGYFMRRISGKWKASEGNGGPGMYERVERFVTNLTEQPRYSLDMGTQASGNCISQYDYDRQREKSGK